MVRLGGTGLLSALTSSSSSSSSSSPSSTSSLSSKLGVAAPTDNVYSKVRLDKEVSDAEALHRKQVAKIVAQLTPEQIAAQQVVVEKHVKGQAETEGLSELERIQLQVDTLQHNGLPIPDDMMDKIKSATSTTLSSISSDDTSVNMLGNLLGSATGLVSSIFSEKDENSEEAPTSHTDLPEQGTLEHTIMLNLFNAQQSVNMFLNSIFGEETDPNHIGGGQFVANDKIGEALDENETDGNSILSMPSKLLRSLPVSPGTAALGLLTTGAVGSVIYSYAVNSPPGSLATSATSLAKGAVEEVQRRKDEMVAAASSAFARVAGVGDEGDKEEEGNYIYYYDDDVRTPLLFSPISISTLHSHVILLPGLGGVRTIWRRDRRSRAIRGQVQRLRLHLHGSYKGGGQLCKHQDRCLLLHRVWPSTQRGGVPRL